MDGFRGMHHDTALAAATVELHVTQLQHDPRYPRREFWDADLADPHHQHALAGWPEGICPGALCRKGAPSKNSGRQARPLRLRPDALGSRNFWLIGKESAR